MPSSSTLAFDGLKVLVTSGPTAVAIDGTRILTNCSTGEMGRIIARELSLRGAKVTLLEGAVTSAVSPANAVIKKFFYFDELARILKNECLKQPDWVIHAAAVSDFTPISKFPRKLSSGKLLTLKLKPTLKLVDQIKQWSPATRLVAFKLEDTLDSGAFRKADHLFATARADFVLLNRVTQGYEACVIRQDRTRTTTKKSKLALVRLLLTEINKFEL